MTELEILRSARQTIATGWWDFGDWKSCTCGHIYAAAGLGAPSAEQVTGRAVEGKGRNWGAYKAALDAVVRAAPELAERAREYRGRFAVSAEPVVMLVSDMTKLAARSANGDKREAALRLLDAAISLEEANHEAARLQVLASAQRDASDPHSGGLALLDAGQRWRSEERGTIRELTNAGR